MTTRMRGMLLPITLVLASCGHESRAVGRQESHASASHSRPSSPIPAGSSQAASLASAASSRAQPRPTLAVVVDASGVWMQGDPKPLLPLPTDASHGADAAFKRDNNRSAFEILPLEERIQADHNAGRLSGPLRLVFDPAIPYRVLLEVIFTASKGGADAFEVCETACDKRSFEYVGAKATASRSRSDTERSLQLWVSISAEGIGLRASGENVGPQCSKGRKGIALPRAAGLLDLPALWACVARLKGADPAFASEEQAIVMAADATPFREVMDVARTLQGPSKTGFSKLTFASPL